MNERVGGSFITRYRTVSLRFMSPKSKAKCKPLQLILSHIQTLSDASAADDFIKQFGKRRNYSQCSELYSTIILSFAEIFQILANKVSKSSAEDVSGA